MKKLFCKLGVVFCFSAVLFFLSSMACGTMPFLIALCGMILSITSIHLFWEAFVRFELSDRRRARRRVRLPAAPSVRPFHAA